MKLLFIASVVLISSIAPSLLAQPSTKPTGAEVATNSVEAAKVKKSAPVEKPREYRLSEITRSIAFGQACESADNGDSTKSIGIKTLGVVLAREPQLSRKDAKVLTNILVRSAIDKCGSLGSN